MRREIPRFPVTSGKEMAGKSFQQSIHRESIQKRIDPKKRILQQDPQFFH
jgi:hypothetical protein